MTSARGYGATSSPCAAPSTRAFRDFTFNSFEQFDPTRGLTPPARRAARMRILITAGPTREYLDDVRFLSNASSGKMGYALAGAALTAGHEVILVSGPVSLSPPLGC